MLLNEYHAQRIWWFFCAGFVWIHLDGLWHDEAYFIGFVAEKVEVNSALLVSGWMLGWLRPGMIADDIIPLPASRRCVQRCG